MREVSGYTRSFRVLALSATPGDDLKASLLNHYKILKIDISYLDVQINVNSFKLYFVTMMSQGYDHYSVT